MRDNKQGGAKIGGEEKDSDMDIWDLQREVV